MYNIEKNVREAKETTIISKEVDARKLLEIYGLVKMKTSFKMNLINTKTTGIQHWQKKN